MEFVFQRHLCRIRSLSGLIKINKYRVQAFGGSRGMVFIGLKLPRVYMRSSTLFYSLFLCSVGFAQQPAPIRKPKQQQTKPLAGTSQKFNVSGYIQTQYQWGEKAAELRVGTPNENREAPFERFGIRRGRIKLSYEYDIVSAIFQPDITEKGVKIKDAFLNIKDPWLGISALRIGVFNRPFGHEIAYSSALRESPERSIIFRTLFPEERDVGAQLTLQPPKISAWNFLKLEAGLFWGNGIQYETDSHKDFIGHLSVDKAIDRGAKLGFGLSYYHGGVYQGTENIYAMRDRGFSLNNHISNKGAFAKREYVGLDGQFSIITGLGMTKVRAEYLFGTQPGIQSNSKSPNESELSSKDTYMRSFSGGYVILVQDFGKSSFSGLLKYDWYDPNTEVFENEIGLSKTGKGDITRSAFGFGLVWRATKSLRLQTYYEVNNNETTSKLISHMYDIQDDVFTLRLQYKF